MTGRVCRKLGKDTENMEARVNSPSLSERKDNLAAMTNVLDLLMIKRTATSKTIDDQDVLVKLPPHETRRITCPYASE